MSFICNFYLKSSILHSADDSDDKNKQKPKSKMTVKWF